MLDPQHFLAYVVRPSLDSIGLWSPAAQRLLLGTAIAESQLTWLGQHGDGPARYWEAHFNSALGAGAPEDFLTRAEPVLETL